MLERYFSFSLFFILYSPFPPSSRHLFHPRFHLCSALQTDTFKLELPDVGEPFKLRVGHDNSGAAAAWHLDTIELHNLAAGTVYTFIAQRWLSRKDGDKEIVIELPVAKAEKFKDGKKVDMDVSKGAKLVKYTVGGGEEGMVVLVGWLCRLVVLDF